MIKKPFENSTTCHNIMQVTTNLIVLRFLRACGYPMRNIRKALFLLNDIEEQAMAAALGLNRQTMNKTSLGQRRNPIIQEKIARSFGVPLADMFPNDENVAATYSNQKIHGSKN